MFKTLISKFTILYWLFFFFVIVPLYLFAILHFQNVLKESEEEKITLTFNTLKPIIAYNISFEQEELIEDTLESFFEHPDIYSVKLTTVDGNVLFFKENEEHTAKRYFHYSSFIQDPFTDNKLATATIEYSNEHLDHIVSNLLLLLGAIFTFALAVFMVGFLYLRNDLNGLAKLSRWLKQYMQTKKLEPIEIPGKSTEVQTI
ncbi:MAG: hypothetical protein R3302_05245, partial [Sulfurimonadaceae bacterium]|nr:hypothetical protein [Sulfurimonadaceae bacterium]